MQRTTTTVSVSVPVTAEGETTSQTPTTSPARAPVERVGNDAVERFSTCPDAPNHGTHGRV